MVAYMNKEALRRTIDSGLTWFWSRSRNQYWQKGETSGNIQKVINITYDCDADCLLIQVEQKGSGCHTGAQTCFHNSLIGEKKPGDNNQIAELFQVINKRKQEMPEGSYTTKLIKEGLELINAKIEEEADEVIEAAVEKDKSELVWEISDLLYHLLVLAAYKDVTLDEINEELARRSK